MTKFESAIGSHGKPDDPVYKAHYIGSLAKTGVATIWGEPESPLN